MYSICDAWPWVCAGGKLRQATIGACPRLKGSWTIDGMRSGVRLSSQAKYAELFCSRRLRTSSRVLNLLSCLLNAASASATLPAENVLPSKVAFMFPIATAAWATCCIGVRAIGEGDQVSRSSGVVSNARTSLALAWRKSALALSITSFMSLTLDLFTPSAALHEQFAEIGGQP